MAGYDVLIAVDRRGDVVKRVQLREGVNEERAVAWLEELLERVDPRQCSAWSIPPLPRAGSILRARWIRGCTLTRARRRASAGTSSS
jgi:hypothetical protein